MIILAMVSTAIWVPPGGIFRREAPGVRGYVATARVVFQWLEDPFHERRVGPRANPPDARISAAEVAVRQGAVVGAVATAPPFGTAYRRVLAGKLGHRHAVLG